MELHVLTAAYSVAGGQATRVEREEFGGINLIIWLIIEATAETKRAYSVVMLMHGIYLFFISREPCVYGSTCCKTIALSLYGRALRGLGLPVCR